MFLVFFLDTSDPVKPFAVSFLSDVVTLQCQELWLMVVNTRKVTHRNSIVMDCLWFMAIVLLPQQMMYADKPIIFKKISSSFCVCDSPVALVLSIMNMFCY